MKYDINVTVVTSSLYVMMTMMNYKWVESTETSDSVNRLYKWFSNL